MGGHTGGVDNESDCGQAIKTNYSRLNKAEPIGRRPLNRNHQPEQKEETAALPAAAIVLQDANRNRPALAALLQSI